MSQRIFAVLGAGRQGVAAAYDMVKFGSPDVLRLADLDLEVAREGADKINGLLNTDVVQPVQVDVCDEASLASVLEGVATTVSAIHYGFNVAITKGAIAAGSHMTDLGGNTGVTREQLAMDDAAKAAGVRIVPDCGMAPGINIALSQAVMAQLDQPRDVSIYCGGLTQNPQPPWDYECPFSMAGLTNEYDGLAQIIEDGKIVDVPCFSLLEELDFPMLADSMKTLEAFITSGGLSTAPWTYKGKLNKLTYKTLRIPGHTKRFVHYRDLGLFSQEPMEVKGEAVVPRDVFHALLENQVGGGRRVKDLGIIRARAEGLKDGKEATAEITLLDYYDETTGLTAMERITGWHAAMVALYSEGGGGEPGGIPLAEAMPWDETLEAARRRGIEITGPELI